MFSEFPCQNAVAYRELNISIVKVSCNLLSFSTAYRFLKVFKSLLRVTSIYVFLPEIYKN
jgi:hypothetical protein